MKRVIAAVTLVGAIALLLTGCAGPSPEAACAVYNDAANKLAISSYPVGTASVSYDELNDAGVGHWENTVGVITTSDGIYRLDVKDLPDDALLTSSYNDPASNAAIFINTPQTGYLGFTLGCFTKGIDANGIPTTFVRLPTSGQ